MAARIDKSAYGVVFALVGMALCIALAYAMTLIRVYGPTARAVLIDTAYTAHEFAAEAWGWKLLLGMILGAVLTTIMAMALERIDP